MTTSGKSWKSETVFFHGDDYYASLCHGISLAKETIDLECYIFSEDKLGQKIIQRLLLAARRGVHIRVMVDDIGSPGWASHFLPALSLTGIEARVYHPVPWSFVTGPLFKLRSLKVILNLARKMNRRNHRKTCIVDGKTAWVGSMNISTAHLASASGKNAWRDTGVKIEGKGIPELTWAFERAWAEASNFNTPTRPWRRFFRRAKVPPPTPSGMVRLNNTRALRRQSTRELVALFLNSRTRIWITNAYFIPNRRITVALMLAAESGVDVRILVPQKPDIFFTRWIASLYYHQLMHRGVRIFEYVPSVLHAKTILVDDTTLVGSSNLNHRSLMHDLEVDIYLSHEESRQAIEAQYLKDLKHAQEIFLGKWNRISWIERAIGKVLFLFRYWI